MEKELEILKHINELYVGDTTDEEIIRFAEKNTEKVAAWKAAFAKYDLADVLQVVDEYWNFKNNKTSPRVAQILAILNSKKEVEKDSFWYQKAVDAILAERVDRQPEARFWDYGRKVKECFERGFFDDVDEIAENIRQREIFGKENAMLASVKESGNWLASHWKAGA